MHAFGTKKTNTSKFKVLRLNNSFDAVKLQYLYVFTVLLGNIFRHFCYLNFVEIYLAYFVFNEKYLICLDELLF